MSSFNSEGREFHYNAVLGRLIEVGKNRRKRDRERTKSSFSDPELEKYVTNRSTRVEDFRDDWRETPLGREALAQLEKDEADTERGVLVEEEPDGDPPYHNVLIRRSVVMDAFYDTIDDSSVSWTRGSMERGFEAHLDRALKSIEGEKALQKLMNRTQKGNNA